MNESIDFEIFLKLNENSPENIFFLKGREPFRFLVTVILSGHSTDKMAEYSAEQLFSVYPDAKAISEATEEEIGGLIRSSGLFRAKARNILLLARTVVEKGGIPDTMEELTKLPGIGEKTAACYLSAILGQPAVVVDTHFARTSRRLGIAGAKDPAGIAAEIRSRFPSETWNRLSDTVNLLGRNYCRPKPNCRECFMKDLCPSVNREV